MTAGLSHAVCVNPEVCTCIVEAIGEAVVQCLGGNSQPHQMTLEFLTLTLQVSNLRSIATQVAAGSTAEVGVMALHAGFSVHTLGNLGYAVKKHWVNRSHNFHGIATATI